MKAACIARLQISVFRLQHIWCQRTKQLKKSLNSRTREAECLHWKILGKREICSRWIFFPGGRSWNFLGGGLRLVQYVNVTRGSTETSRAETRYLSCARRSFNFRRKANGTVPRSYVPKPCTTLNFFISHKQSRAEVGGTFRFSSGLT